MVIAWIELSISITASQPITHQQTLKKMHDINHGKQNELLPAEQETPL